MKRLYAVLFITAIAVGAWYGQHLYSMRDTTMNADDGEHHHLIQKRDAEGKIYYTCSMHPQVHLDHPGNCPICGMSLIKRMEPVSMNTESTADKKPLYWYDPMKPDQHFDQPGKSPFMDMQLVPMYAGQDAQVRRPGTNAGLGAADDQGAINGSNIISIDPRVVQNLGIRTVDVESRNITQELRVAGSVAANENRIEVVQTRAAGWVERLHVRAVNDAVTKGQLLAEVYSPDLYAAQQEFLLAVKAKDAVLTEGARQRLSLLGMSVGQINRVEQYGIAQKRIAYYAPVDGIVMELGVRDGAQISPGMSLYTLADLSKVWVIAEVPEAQAANLKKSLPVEATLTAIPGRSFKGRIDYVYPEVNPQTRTVRIRAVLDNKGLLLKPGMFADVSLGQGETRDALMIPSEAIIRTGTRSTVIVAEAEGRFRPAEVRLGTQREGLTEVLEGLEAGQKVVASGQFLIDSEANMRGAFNKLDAIDKGLEKTP